MENTLFNAKIILLKHLSPGEIVDELWSSLNNYERIYSYVLYAEEEYYRLDYMLAERNDYNCVPVSDVLGGVLTAIINDQSSQHIIHYAQPTIEVLIDVMQPLVHKLAKEQHEHWKCFDYEDLTQMCNYIICKLYSKGYYIHKKLIRKSYINYVLMQLRARKDEPQFLSIYQHFAGDNELEKLTLADTLVDDVAIETEEELNEYSVNQKIFQEVKDIIIELVGPRQFDQLFRDYSKKHTTAQTRKLMQKVKNHFSQLGISIKEFNDKYYG